MYFSDTKQLLQVKAFGCCFHIDMKTVENIGTRFHSGRNVAQKKMENLLSFEHRQGGCGSRDI